MAHLEIVYLTGDVERHELSKQQPITIGSHRTNDICVDEDAVEMMHARVSWNKTGFEVVAAGVEGVELNGTIVQRSPLKGGDVLRFGSVDIRYRTAPGDGPESANESNDTTGLKGAEDLEPTVKEARGKQTSAGKPSKGKKQKEDAGDAPGEPSWDALAALAGGDAESPMNESDLFDDEGDDFVEYEEDNSPPPAGRSSSKGADPPDRGKKVDAGSDELQPSRSSGSSSKDRSKVREAMRHRRVRPGEEDTIRSPLILGLGGGAAILTLVAFVFYYMASRTDIETAFAQGAEPYEAKKYGEAIQALKKFTLDYPKHELRKNADVLLGMAELDQIVFVNKDYPLGLEKIDELKRNLAEHGKPFEDQAGNIAERARVIALGAAERAGAERANIEKATTLLEVSDKARTLFKAANLDAALKPEEQVAQIEKAKRASQAAILKYQTQQQTNNSVAASLNKSDTIAAIKAWRDLVSRYPELKTDTKTRALLTSILQAEMKQVKRDEDEADAETMEAVATIPPTLTPVFHARSRTDEVSVGTAVCALAQDCCYGIDTTTGQAIWRRSIGVRTPFFPISDTANGAALLFDTRRQELVSVNQNTGELIWRQSIGDRASSAPLLLGGQVFLPTESGELIRIDAQTGKRTASLKFAQAISTPTPLQMEGEDRPQRLIVTGAAEMVYILSLIPLECVRVDYTAHPFGSVATPLLAARSYLLMCQNESSKGTATLRLFDAWQGDGPIVEVAKQNVPGLILDPPVIRGRDLFVPSSGEMVSAFTLSEEPGQEKLSLGPFYQEPDGRKSPIYLSTGPDRQVWMSCSAVRRLQLSGDGLTPDQKVVAVGIASQPLQYIDRRLFNGRRSVYADAVTVTRIERDELDSDTQVVLGARVLALSVNETDASSMIVANEAGQVFRLMADRLATGGIQSDGAERLPIDESVKTPLVAVPLPKGQLAVAAGGDNPKMWILNRLGRIDRFVSLDDVPQTPPVAMGTRVLIPLKGRLSMVSITSGQPRVEDFTLPTDAGDDAVWSQVFAVNATDCVAVLKNGTVHLIRHQSSPRHFLNSAATISLGSPVLLQGATNGTLVALADATGTLHLLKAEGLEPFAKAQLKSIASNIQMVNDTVFVETGDGTLHCLKVDATLGELWKLPLDGSSLAGSPLLHEGQLLVPVADGRLLALDPVTGEVKKTIESGGALNSGPYLVGTDLYLNLLDGSLAKITELLKN
ncbi:MAG: PQQ-binding-like beta-propeller repeat protein [Planctomycetaceae bacterium]